MAERILRTCLFKFAKIALIGWLKAQTITYIAFRGIGKFQLSGIFSSVGQGLETLLCDTGLYWDWMHCHNCHMTN